jgi:hypothetical protein
MENVINDVHTIVEVDDDIDGMMPPPDEGLSVDEIEANDLQRMIGHRFLWRKMQEKNYPSEEFDKLYKTHFADIKTMGQLNNAIRSILQSMNG